MVYELLLIAQESGTPAVKEAVKEGVEKAADPAGGGLFSNPLLWMPLVVLMIFWLMAMILPGRKEQNRVKQMLESLKKNDRVLTSAGIKGTVVNIDKNSPFVTIRIDESTNAKMQVLRSAISRILKGDEKDFEETETK